MVERPNLLQLQDDAEQKTETTRPSRSVGAFPTRQMSSQENAKLPAKVVELGVEHGGDVGEI